MDLWILGLVGFAGLALLGLWRLARDRYDELTH